MSVAFGIALDAPRVDYAYDHQGTRVARSALPDGSDGAKRYLTDYENPTGYSQTLAEVGGNELNQSATTSTAANTVPSRNGTSPAPSGSCTATI